VWALVLHRLRGAESAYGDRLARAGQALADTVLDVARAAPASRLNLLLTDGSTIMATAWGDDLWYRTGPGEAVVVASEPYDDDPGWHQAPEHTLLVAHGAEVRLTSLKEPAA
jgi:glutamine amidotransferase